MRLAAVLLVLVAVPASIADATVFVPLGLDELLRSADATVLATVREIATARLSDDRIARFITLEVDAVLGGNLVLEPLVLRERGGESDGVREDVIGAPHFTPGESALLFLAQRTDGSWHTHQMSMGKWSLVDDNDRWFIERRFDPRVHIIPGDPAADRVALDDFLTASGLPAVPVPSSARRTSRAGNRFELLGPARFFEFDEDATLDFLIDRRGDGALGFDAARRAVDAALAAWNEVADTRIGLRDIGATDDIGAGCSAANLATSIVRFDDPDGDIPAPVACRGVLAMGGSCNSTFEKKAFHDRSFARARRGTLTFADGWQNCAVWTECNLAEIAAHELGHVIGFDHSSEDPNEPGPEAADATMYYRAHFDGRCAGLRRDDERAAQFVYPAAIPPTITSPSPLPDAAFGIPYFQTLAAIGGTAPYTWSSSPDRGGVPGLSVSPQGDVIGTPTAGGVSFLLVTATDARGDRHTKVLNLRVAIPPTVAPTAMPSPTLTSQATPSPTRTPSAADTMTPTASITATPSPSATVSATGTPTGTPTATTPPLATPTATAAPTPGCAGDCDGDGGVTVDEILRLVNLALGDGDEFCPAGDGNHDGHITVEEILTAVDRALRGCSMPP